MYSTTHVAIYVHSSYIGNVENLSCTRDNYIHYYYYAQLDSFVLVMNKTLEGKVNLIRFKVYHLVSTTKLKHTLFSNYISIHDHLYDVTSILSKQLVKHFYH